LEKDLQPAKATFPPTNSPPSNAPCNTPGSWEPSASEELSTKPPTLDVYRTGCPSAPCQATVSSRGGKAVKRGQQSDCRHSGEAGKQIARRVAARINQLSNISHLERQEGTWRKIQLRSGSCRGQLCLLAFWTFPAFPLTSCSQFPFTTSQSFTFPYSYPFTTSQSFTFPYSYLFKGSPRT